MTWTSRWRGRATPSPPCSSTPRSTGSPPTCSAKALHQARDARLKILDVMAGAITEPRPEVSENAPKIVSFQIPVDRIGEVIGPKGKVINTLQAETGADITVDDDGMFGIVTIGAKDGGAVDGGQAPDLPHRRAPRGRGRRRLPGQGGEHHQVRGLRQHPPGTRRAAAHLQDRRRQARRPGGGRPLPGPGARGEGGRHRPPGQGVAVARR